MSTDQLAKDFLKKTGLDLRNYRHHDLISSISGLIDLSDLSGRAIRIPFIISIILVGLVYSQATTPLQTNFAYIGGIIFTLLNTLALFNIIFTLRMKEIFTTLLQTTLDLSNQAASDIQTLQKGQHEGTLEAPSFSELTSATLKIVAFPLLQDSISKSFPILGRALLPMTRWLGRIVEKRTLKKITTQQAPSSTTSISPEQLARYQEIATTLKKQSRPLITICSHIALLPSLISLLILWIIFSTLYLLLF